MSNGPFKIFPEEIKQEVVIETLNSESFARLVAVFGWYVRTSVWPYEQEYRVSTETGFDFTNFDTNVNISLSNFHP